MFGWLHTDNIIRTHCTSARGRRTCGAGSAHNRGEGIIFSLLLLLLFRLESAENETQQTKAGGNKTRARSNVRRTDV